ncbi:amine oxidase [Nitzschia inconspicua]|uniref:Amine oxidase n=1 Tax=Nitzschia inconspicua TaxID=303405 RepID=A0A9K3Q5L0_9STRA|nr:amine oxidase [Nitzschia inconspicua]
MRQHCRHLLSTLLLSTSCGRINSMSLNSISRTRNSSISLGSTISDDFDRQLLPQQQQQQQQQQPLKVVVVGAGFSGLSTAYHLLRHNGNSNNNNRPGLLEVRIVEARDRIGGRVHPFSLDDETDDTMVDLGGQWLHEASETNPIRRLMEDDLHLGFIVPKKQSQETRPRKGRRQRRRQQQRQQQTKNVIFDQDGTRIATAVVKKATNIFYKALDQYEYDDPDITPTTSFQDLLQQQLQLERLSDRRLERIDGPALQRTLNYLTHKTEGYEGGRLHEVSALMADMYQNKGGPDRLPQGTYASVLRKLQDQLEQTMGCRIQLKSPVTSIVYDPLAENGSPNNGIILTIETDQDGTTTTIHCDYCVCTVPLGVLQQGRIQFDPPLPTHRLGAIQAMGMGLLNKIVLKFDECFWGDLKQFGMAHDDPTQVKTFYDCSDGIVVTESDAPSGGILIHFLAGAAADHVEFVDANGNSNAGLSDEEAVAESLASLRCIFGVENVPQSAATKVTRWRQDPYSCGSYSFTKVRSTEDMYSEVASPLGNLLFAGEHTSKTTHSTVHGAWETGEREAQRLLKLLASSNSRVT